MKGGIVNTLIYKAAGVVGIAIVIGMFLVPTMGGPKTASLYGTTAIVGGTSTGITFGSLPAFFKSVATGWDLVKSDDTPAPKTSGKSSAKNGG